MEAFRLLCRTEGIIPAIESAHALAGAMQLGREAAGGRRDGRDPVILVNLSGRGDKDVETAARWFDLLDDEPVVPADQESSCEHGRRSGRQVARRDLDGRGRAALVGYLPVGFPDVDGVGRRPSAR